MVALAGHPANHATARLQSTGSARAVFDEARKLVQLQQPQNESIQNWLKDKYNIDDVYEAVAAVQQQYAKRPKSRARKWLAEFAAGVSTYGKILDVLVQQHPEYVSLIWGTTKFLFVVVQNHEEVVTELAKSLSRISTILPRVKIHINLFPVPAMRRAVLEIYDALIAHLHETLKFYQKGRIRKAWRALIQPYALKFKGHVEKIDTCSREVESLAQALAHQEGRQMHEDIQSIQKVLQKLDNGQEQTQTLMQAVCSKIAAHFETTAAHYFATKDMRTAQMIAAAKDTIFQDPMDVFSFRLSFSRRHQAACRSNLCHLWQSPSLRRWSMSPKSGFLLASGSLPLRKESVIFGTLMARFITQAGVAALWALQSASTENLVKTSPERILQYLTLQAMKINAETLEKVVSPTFNHTKIAAASTVQQWEQLLASALAGLSLVYILIDLDVLENVREGSASIVGLVDSMQRLKDLCPTTVLKIALISFRRTGLPCLDRYTYDSLDIKASASSRWTNRRSAAPNKLKIGVSYNATAIFRNRFSTNS